MKIIVKNKFFSATGKSFATDEMGNTVFSIKGAFSFTRRKSIYDKEDVLLFSLRNKYFSFVTDKVYIYDANEEHIATLISKRFDFKNKYTLEDYKDEVTFSGNLFQFPNIKLEISKNGKVIGLLTKQFNIARDSFTIDVEESENLALLVALTIAIDNILDKKKNRNN